MKKQTKSVKKVLKSDPKVTKTHKTNTNPKQEPLAKVVNLRSIVYTLKDDGVDNDTEMLYSLRSLDMYGKNYANVVIVGHLPSFVNPEKVIHIPARDNSYKAANIKNKLLAACADSRVSDDFIHMNDDYFLTQDWDFSTQETYYKEINLHDYIYSDRRWYFYTLIVQKTYELLKSMNLPIEFYDLHYPFLFNKDKFVDLMVNKIDWESPDLKQKGYVIRSLYGNYFQPEAKERKDCKISKLINFEPSLKLVKEQGIFSTENLEEPHILKIFETLYPKKSEFEL